jgi:hypothetical protein
MTWGALFAGETANVNGGPDTSWEKPGHIRTESALAGTYWPDWHTSWPGSTMRRRLLRIDRLLVATSREIG